MINRPYIYQLVPEDKRAWHAGKSAWKDRNNINDTSIGIEIVNMGCDEQNIQKNTCDPYQKKQIESLIVLLKDLQQRYQVFPENVLGHADVAPFRKVDPGPLFPWQKLADAGLIIWPQQERIDYYLQGHNPQEWVEIGLLQKLLKDFGYTETPQTGVLDNDTKTIIRTFQMHFRNRDISGNPDRETMAILQTLLEVGNNN
ncbi:hypothetical protein GKC56_00145 [Neisseriaceae bacterium PsAf]|nr:hypothetical protein [Neisseriaceae bacterium PsAf]